MRAAIVALLLTLSLSSCGDPAAGGDYEESMSQAAPAGEPDVKAIAREAIRQQDYQFESMSDGDLDRIFEITCEGFDDGLSASQVAIAGMDTFDSSIGAVMMGAVMAYCPEYRLKVEAWTEQYS